MPRVHRRGHTKRTLTTAQREILEMGYPLLDFLPGENFSSEPATRAAWCEHRDRIMADYTAKHPGQRPWGRWRFDLKQDHPGLFSRWWKETAILEEKGLLDRDEEARIEAHRQILAADQCPDYLGLQTIDSMHRRKTSNIGMEWRIHSVNEDIDESTFAAGWHKRRGRAELVTKYRQRVDALQALLKEGLDG